MAICFMLGVLFFAIGRDAKESGHKGIPIR